MTFAKLAAAQQALRQAAAALEKNALVKGLFGAAGRLAVGAGKRAIRAGSWAVQHPIPAAGLALGSLAAGSEIKGGYEKYKKNQAGFRPEIQEYQSQPQVPQVPQP